MMLDVSGRNVSGRSHAASQCFADAETQHEALPDLHGIAAGGPGARLVVDPHVHIESSIGGSVR